MHQKYHCNLKKITGFELPFDWNNLILYFLWLIFLIDIGFNDERTNAYNNEEILRRNMEEESEFISSSMRGGRRGGSRRIKVEKLGNTLRKRVSKLRSREGVDLVFLVDSSASVGSQNFHNEIKFIRKVLSFVQFLSTLINLTNWLSIIFERNSFHIFVNLTEYLLVTCRFYRFNKYNKSSCNNL